MKTRNIVALVSAFFVVSMLTVSMPASAGTLFVDGVKVEVCQGSTCAQGEGSGNGGGEGGVGIGIAEASATATATVDNTNQQQQQQQQTATATVGDTTATGGSVTVGDTTLTTGASTSSAVVESGAVQNTNTITGSNTLAVESGAVQNTNTLAVESGAVTNTVSTGDVTNTNTAEGGAGGSINVYGGEEGGSSPFSSSVNIADGAVQNTNSNTAEGGVGVGGEGGSVNIAEGAVENNSSATASTGDVVVNNNFGGEDGNTPLATQNVEGSTQVVEGSVTNVTVDASTDFRRAPVASVAPVFSGACSGGMSFQAQKLGMSVGDAEHYCKLLQLADARFGQAQTIVLIPPTPPVLADCTGNVPDYVKGSSQDNTLAKEATATCFRQNQAAMDEYAVVVDAYNKAMVDRTVLMNQAYALVDDAEHYVRKQQTLTNVAENSRKIAYPLLLVKGIMLLFF